ncbi:MAG: amidohydrolase family protein [Nocardioidaceae bacterium]|nr:amidohydrolase family protein [Nocardioidaceae bacterium]
MDPGRRVLHDGAVAISGDRIAAVATAPEMVRTSARRVLDCRGSIVLPGLVDTHTHSYQTFARSLGEGRALWSWLAGFLWPYASRLTAEDARVATLLAAAEAALAGTTAVLDHHYAPADPATVQLVADAWEEVGLRGVVARGMAGTPSPVATRHGLAGELFAHDTPTELALTRACIEDRLPGSRVRVWGGPHNVAYADQALLRGADELAAETGTRWHAHCASTVGDPATYRAAYGTTPVAWLHRQGLLGPRATLAHAIHLDDAEVAALGEAGAGVAHCPVSNQYGADGVLRLAALRAAGAVVGLGTDGAAYNHRQDLFECMKQAVLLQRISTLDPAAASSADALELVTLGGARLLGLDAGALVPGLLADVTVVGLGAPHLTPHHDTTALLTYAVRGADVTTTIVGGEIVVERGRCTRVDVEALCAEATGRARALARSAGIDTTARPGGTR